MELLNKETFKSKIFNYEESRDWKFGGSKPAIIDFYASWCGPCQTLSPILDEVAQKYEGLVDVYKVNTEDEPELAALFSVRSIPAILFIPTQGKPSMANGLMPVTSFDQAIGDLLGIKLNQEKK